MRRLGFTLVFFFVASMPPTFAANPANEPMRPAAPDGWQEQIALSPQIYSASRPSASDESTINVQLHSKSSKIAELEQRLRSGSMPAGERFGEWRLISYRPIEPARGSSYRMEFQKDQTKGAPTMTQLWAFGAEKAVVVVETGRMRWDDSSRSRLIDWAQVQLSSVSRQ